MSDIVFIDGVDLESYLTHIEFQGFGDLFSTAGLAGGNYKSPNTDGEKWREKAREAGSVSLRFASLTPLRGPKAEGTIAAEWDRLVSLVTHRRRPLLMRRVKSVMTEHGLDDIEQEALVELTDSIAPSWISKSAQRGSLTFTVLEGRWFSPVPRKFDFESDVPFHLPVVGTTDTSRMTIHLSGKTDVGVQRLTNVSAGVWVEVDYAKTIQPSASPLNLIVDEFRANREFGGDLWQQLRAVSHAGDKKFMILDPREGDNEMLLTGGGTGRIEWRDAWL